MPAPKTLPLDQVLHGEYAELYTSCELLDDKRALVEAAARAIHAHKERYEALAALTKVPWYVIGAVHARERDLRFDCHFHNGDPLTARTVDAPEDRPLEDAYFRWEASALAALTVEGFLGWEDWTASGLLYKLEGYNGFGYRLDYPLVKTPYLWSCTSHYEKGAYGADGRFDPDLVPSQIGVAALLRMLEELDLIEIVIAPPPRGLGTGAAVSAPPYPGRLIRRGEANVEIVRAIQERLLVLGFGPTDKLGDFGPATETAVRRFQAGSVDGAGVPLGVDGLVGPRTWQALFSGPSAPPAEGDKPSGTTGGLGDVAPLVLGARSGGLLRRAVEQGLYEPPSWVEIEFDGLLVRVGAHALRASIGGRLLRAPVSYADAIAIANALGWIPPTAPLADAIWKAATVRVLPVPLGDRRTPAASAVTDRKMLTLEFVVKHSAAIDAQIPPGRWAELTATEGKDWILSKRNLTARRAATTYGWHDLNGKPIQGLGPDSKPPAHDDAHSDYSQTLRPIQRKARRKADGVEVDLRDEIAARGMPTSVLAPLALKSGLA